MNENKMLDELTIDQAYQKARKMKKKNMIMMDAFINYKDIEEDKQKVVQLKKIFAEEIAQSSEKDKAQKLAVIFEEIFFEQAELSNWLGPNVATIQTTEYDDYKNGVDSVAEIHESATAASYLGLAIDVTLAAELDKKFDRIKKEIEDGTLTTIKYFASSDNTFHGQLGKVPRVIIGADARTVKQLSEIWLEENKASKNTFADHPVQMQILKEILLQLETFENYATQVKQHEIAGIYEKTKNLLEPIYNEKLQQFPDFDDNDLNDQIFQEIKNQTKYL